MYYGHIHHYVRGSFTLRWRHNDRHGVPNHVYSHVCWGAHQRKYQSPASLAFIMGIHRSPVDSPHKGPVTRKVFPFDDVIMIRMDVVCMIAPLAVKQRWRIWVKSTSAKPPQKHCKVRTLGVISGMYLIISKTAIHIGGRAVDQSEGLMAMYSGRG